MVITFFDVLFLMIMLVGAAVGFFRGLIRQSISTLIIYVSTVVSTLTYRGLSNLLAGAGRSGTAATGMLSFVILMVVLNLLLILMANDMLKDYDLERLGMIGNLGGLVFGFLNTAIFCAIALIVIRSATAGDPWIGYEGVRTFFQSQTQNSWMAFIFGPFMRVVIATIRPWLFGRSLPPLLINAF
ncbi:MAG: CvpA family protein [Anaerolineae bacterium]|nr:CvpA family protein [Anaerolineae bacterium]